MVILQPDSNFASEFHREISSVKVSVVKDFVEVVLLDRVRVGDNLRFDQDESLHVVGDIGGKAGAEESERNLGHDWIELDDVEHGLLDSSIITLSLWNQGVV